MRKIFFLLLSLTLCFSSCSKQEDEVGGENPTSTFTAESMPSDKSHADFKAETKDGKVLYFMVTSSSTCKIVPDKESYEPSKNYVIGSLAIPSHVNYQGEKLAVTEVGNNAFDECPNLSEVFFPATLKKIGENAFANCSALTTINVPDGVTSIGFQAFAGCKNVININIPEGVSFLASKAFSGCKITQVNIPSSITEIRSGVFAGCEKLTSIKYKNKEYSSKKQILDALESNHVILGDYIFDFTALSD